MNWLQKVFTSKRERDLLSFIAELKQDKERLYEENIKLKEQLFNMLNNVNSVKETKIKPLTPKEQKIYDIFMSNNNITLKELSKKSKIKETSLKVYISRIRSKGFEIKV